MAQLSKGTTYATNDQVTAANLNALVDSGTLLPGAITDQTAAVSVTGADTLLVNQGGVLKKATVTQVQTSITPDLSPYLKRDGSVMMSAELTLLSTAPIGALSATSVGYVSGQVAELIRKDGTVPFTGDQLLAPISTSAVASLSAVPVSYVNGLSPYTVKAHGSFSGKYADTTLFSGTYVRAGTTITVTIASHGFVAGHQLYLNITSGGGTTSWYEIQTATTNTFTVIDSVSGATSGGCSFRNCLINANVGGFSVNYAGATAGTAKYFLNLATSATSGYFTVMITGSAYSPSSDQGSTIVPDYMFNGSYGRRQRTSKSMGFSSFDGLLNVIDSGIYCSVVVFHS
jgi:hypothetical protein